MLNIARQIQIAWNTKDPLNSGLYETEIVPVGKTSGEKKKLQSVTKRNDEVMEYNNIPLPGFTLLRTDRKSWGSLDQTWLIIDPRGFLSRITAANLERILHVTGITEGLIQEKCVWARENSQTTMMLVPVTSPDYVSAVQNTDLIENKINLKDVSIGDVVSTQGGLTGTYMGVLSLYGPIHASDNGYRPQVFLRRQVICRSPGIYIYQTDAKILNITKSIDIPLTREEAASQINAELATGSAHFSTSGDSFSNYTSSRGTIKLVSTHAVPRPAMSFIEITKIEAEKLFVIGFNKHDMGMLMLVDKANRKWIVEHPSNSYIKSRTICDHNAFDTSEIITDFSTTELISSPINTHDKWLFQQKDRLWPPCRLDNYVKFYKIVKHVKSDTFV